MHSITSLKTKEGQSTGLVAVEVPKDARSFLIDHSGDLSYEHSIIKTDNSRQGFIAIEYKPKGIDWQILGLVTPDKVGVTIGSGLFANVILKEPDDAAIRSLLAVNGLCWQNKYGATRPQPKYSDYEFGGEGLSENLQMCIEEDMVNTIDEWVNEQSKLLTGNLLILKKV